MIRSVARALLASACSVLAVASCRDAPTAPATGTVIVTLRTTGGDADIDGYRVALSTGATRPVEVSGISVISNVAPGAQMVTLDQVAPNCTVTGGASRPVTVNPGDTVDVAFDIVCAATGIEIRLDAAGTDVPHSFLAVVKGTGEDIVAVRPDSSVSVTRLEPGAFTVSLSPATENCTFAGSRQASARVTLGTVTSVRFGVTCKPAVRLEKIAFALDSIENGVPVSWISVVNVDGSGVTRLGRGDTPRWSRDGTRLVYSSTECVGTYDPVDDFSCYTGLAMLDPELRNDSTLILPKDAYEPAWSPTSDVIAYWQPPRTVFLLRPNDVQPAPLGLGVVDASKPAWSPDGRRLVLECSVPSAPVRVNTICVFDPSAPLVVLATPGGYSAEPAWSPDGRRIAFRSDTSIAVMPADGGDAVLLTRGSSPSWSRDGTRLVFADRDGLYIIDADGSNRTRVTSGPYRAPAWRP